MRVLFAGTPEVALPSLSALLDSRHEVVAVLTRPDAAAGRGRRARPSPVREAAQAAGVPVLTPARLREPGVREQIQRLQPQACPVVAYGALVPAELLALPEHGWVNLHFSLLPAWRGAAPVQHALLHGDEVTGATTFLLEEGLDTGPVLGTLTEPVRSRDTAGDLLGRLAEAGAGLLVASLDALESGRARPVPQPAEGVSHAPRLEPADARVDWSRPAFAIDRLVRACTPAPGAWTTFRGQRLKLGPVQAVRTPGSPAEQVPAVPGELVVHRDRVEVGTGSGALRLGTVQAHGKRAMPATDWARGVRPTGGEVLGG